MERSGVLARLLLLVYTIYWDFSRKAHYFLLSFRKTCLNRSVWREEKMPLLKQIFAFPPALIGRRGRRWIANICRKKIARFWSVYGLDNPVEWVGNQIAKGTRGVIYNKKRPTLSFRPTATWPRWMERSNLCLVEYHKSPQMSTPEIKKNRQPAFPY